MEKLILPAKLENLDKMFAFIKEGASKQGFTKEQANKIQLAFEEAVVNVINYAYPDKDGDVEINYSNKESSFEIEIIDSGKEFNPLSIAAPNINAPIEERKIGGLGIFLIKEIMDEVDYKRENDKNIFKLAKYNADKAKPSDDCVCCRWPLDYMKKETFKKGDWLFKKGDPANKMFYISKGAINLIEIGKIVKEGEVIGEMGIFSPFKQRTASAFCEEDLETFTMGKDEVIKFFAVDPTSAIELIQLSVKRFMENLKKETAARERIESELRIAQEIQLSMLPNVFPERKEFEIYAMMDPAKEVGGDFYDFFFIDDKRLCFVIGDVSGKGVPAALFMAITKTLIKNEAKRGFNTDQVLSRVNNIICPDNPTCQFVTVFCAILNLETGEVQFCNAGHNPPLVCSADECVNCSDKDQECDKKGCFNFMKISGGVVVGVMENAPCKKSSLTLNPGDTILLYTDGVTEAMNPKQEQFSESRVKSILKKIKNEDIKFVLLKMREEIKNFAEGAPQSDDITMLILRYRGKGA